MLGFVNNTNKKTFQIFDIIKLKNIIEYFAKKNNKICQCLLSKWTILKEVKSVLQCPYYATLKLQKVDLTMSDVFGIWLEMDLQLKQIAKKKSNVTDLANNLMNTLQSRRQKVFENSATICAVFLDPRFRTEITVHQIFSTREEAENKLVDLWYRIKSIGENDHNNLSIPTDSNATDTSLLSTSGESINMSQQLSEYLRRGIGQNDENRQATASNDIRSELEAFDPEWHPLDHSVVKFWRDSKDTYPELYKVATTIYAIPPTEVQIERDFSKLENILTKKRMALSAELLEAVLMIHLNPDLFFLIREEKFLNLKSNVVRSLFK